MCQFTPVLCIILNLSHADEFVILGFLPRRQADHIVHVGLLEIGRGAAYCGVV